MSYSKKCIGPFFVTVGKTRMTERTIGGGVGRFLDYQEGKRGFGIALLLFFLVFKHRNCMEG